MKIRHIIGPTFAEVFEDVPMYVGGRPTSEFIRYNNAVIKAMKRHDAPSSGGGQAFDSAIDSETPGGDRAASRRRGFWNFDLVEPFQTAMASKSKAQAFDSDDLRAKSYSKLQSAYNAMADLGRWGKDVDRAET